MTLHLSDIWSEPTVRLGLAPLFEAFAADAAHREVARRLLFEEIAALKARGFGALRIPGADGEPGVALPDLFRIVRDLATADSNIAHALRNHFFAVEQYLAAPDHPLSERIVALARDNALFGVAFSEEGTNPAGEAGRHATTLRWSEQEGVFRYSGVKIYSTGNIYADYLFIGAVNDRTGEPAQALIPRKRDGVSIVDDWEGFGQRLTGSGRTVFTDVAVEEDALLTPPSRQSAEGILHGFTFHQIYLTTAISGVVQRILVDAVELVRGRGRNYYHALAERVADEPEVQSVIGRIAAYRSAVNAVTDRAALALDEAWRNAHTPQAHALSVRASLAAAEAKVVTDEVAATLAGLLTDVASGSGVSAGQALDRHWRNVRVIASHNPRIYKERILGDHYLNGTPLPTGPFF